MAPNPNRHNPNQFDTLLNLWADLVADGIYWTQVDCLYINATNWNDAIDTTFNLFLRRIRQQKRVEELMYAFYVGELLSYAHSSTLWNEFVQSHSIGNSHQYRFGCTRIYQLFKRKPEQIYFTRYISFNVMRRLARTNFEALNYFARMYLSTTNSITQGTL